MIQFFSKTRNLLLLAMLASAALVRAQVALPYSQQFDDISDFETFTVANENNDEDVWRYDDIVQAAKSERNYDADDWLITPIFELEEGKTYELSFKSYIEMFGSESLAVFLGTSKRVSSFTTNILPLTAVTEESATVYTAVFTVEESDDYRIGFHHCTVGDPYSNYLFIDDISLRETISQQAPGPVTDLTVTPGEKGALSALVSMKAPVVAADSFSPSPTRSRERCCRSRIRMSREDCTLTRRSRSTARDPQTLFRPRLSLASTSLDRCRTCTSPTIMTPITLSSHGTLLRWVYMVAISIQKT